MAEFRLFFNQRELIILSHLSKGYGDKQMAQEMDISERAIRYCLTNIHKKLNTKTRSQAVAEAIRLELIA